VPGFRGVAVLRTPFTSSQFGAIGPKNGGALVWVRVLSANWSWHVTARIRKLELVDARSSLPTRRLEEDGALLAAFRRGDEVALRTVYETYSREVARFLSSGCGRAFAAGGTSSRALAPLDLQAAHQETFVRAFRPQTRMAYDGLRPFRAYLFAIARSTLINLLRAQGRIARSSMALEDAPDVEAIASEDVSPEEAALETERRTLVHAFLRSLSAHEQAFATRRFADGLSQDDTAHVLGLSRGEVRVRERKLKAAFFEYLRAAGWR
jgi:RNA polymerase sigma-70 factor, ECF subfamily